MTYTVQDIELFPRGVGSGSIIQVTTVDSLRGADDRTGSFRWGGVLLLLLLRCRHREE